jgi:hypothetical protein
VQTRRALLMLLAGASLFLVLLGPLDVPAAAADTTLHSGALVPRDGSNSPGDPDEHCRHGWSDEPGGDERGCAPKPEPAPTPTPHSAPATTAVPKLAPTRTPRRPRPVLVVPSRSQSASTSAPSAGSPAAGTPTSSPAQRPPVLAPPALTIPPSSPFNAAEPVRGAVDLIALSTVLVAATIAVASLVLVRRSG